MNPREFSICDAYFCIVQVIRYNVQFFFAREVPWVNEGQWTKKPHFLGFLAKEFRNWKYFPKLFVCIKLRSQCVPLHSHLPLSAAQPAARPRLRIMFHSQNYFRFPRWRKTENGTGSELYQSCQAPSHRNCGPGIPLHPRLLWLLDSGIGD